MEATVIDYMGDDLRVVNAARVSFNKESHWETEYLGTNGKHGTTEVLSEKDQKLISYLAKNGHWTPFAHPQITMREKVPIFVARQRFKHMVGFIYNEVSRRYVDDDPEFYWPDEWRRRADNKKQGSSDEIITDPAIDYEYNDLLCRVESLYEDFLKAGVAPEQARMILPQSLMTEYYVTGSLAAWARAYKQRSHPHAQLEIQELAKQWDLAIQPLFPVSWKALTC